jgi:hypothetical protein
MATTAATPPKAARPPPVSFREVAGRQKTLVHDVIEKCETIKIRFSNALDNSLADFQGKSVENVSRVSSNLRSGVGIVLQVIILVECIM